MDKELINVLGDNLYRAFVSNTTLVPFTEQYPDITLEDGYRIQERLKDPTMSSRIAFPPLLPTLRISP